MARKHERPSESSDDDPSPELIAERAAAIRATWTERTERERRVWHGRVEWSLPWIGSEWLEAADVEQINTK